MTIENLSIRTNILYYKEQEELFKDHAPEFLDSLNEEEMCALSNMDDYEDVCYFVIDYETVIVAGKSGGDIYEKFDSMESFVEAVKNLIPEYI